MGSVSSRIECPNCKFEHARIEDYYKSNEIYVNCPVCGYNYSRTIVNRDDWEKLGNKWNPKYEEKELFPDHSTSYSFKESAVTSCGAMKKENMQEFLDFVKENKLKLQSATYTYKKDGEWYIKNLINHTDVKYEYQMIAEEI